jgi:hypothetical protein
MQETGLYFHWPGFFFAFPAIILIVVLPAVLIYVVFARTSLKLWVKVLLIPICLIAPLLATWLWPFLIKVSGFVGATGGDGTLSYTEITEKLFGDYSDYVWGGITTILVLLIYRLLGRKKAC